MKMRFSIIACAVALGCADNSPTPPPIPSVSLSASVSGGQARAIVAAVDWLVAEGRDTKALEFSAAQDGAGWRVFVEELPPRIAGDFMLVMDDNFKVTRLVGGK